MQVRHAAVRRGSWVLGSVLLVVCLGALEVGSCDTAWPESRLGHRALVAGTLAGPLARFGLLGLVDVGGRLPPLSP